MRVCSIGLDPALCHAWEPGPSRGPLKVKSSQVKPERHRTRLPGTLPRRFEHTAPARDTVDTHTRPLTTSHVDRDPPRIPALCRSHSAPTPQLTPRLTSSPNQHTRTQHVGLQSNALTYDVVPAAGQMSGHAVATTRVAMGRARARANNVSSELPVPSSMTGSLVGSQWRHSAELVERANWWKERGGQQRRHRGVY